jgi:hypothetical protein
VSVLTSGVAGIGTTEVAVVDVLSEVEAVAVLVGAEPVDAVTAFAAPGAAVVAVPDVGTFGAAAEEAAEEAAIVAAKFEVTGLGLINRLPFTNVIA